MHAADAVIVLFFMLFRPIFVPFSDNSKAIFLQFFILFLHFCILFLMYFHNIYVLLLFYFCGLFILFSKQSIFIVFASASMLLNLKTD